MSDCSCRECNQEQVTVDLTGCCDAGDCPFRGIDASHFLESLDDLRRMVATFVVRSDSGDFVGFFDEDREH